MKEETEAKGAVMGAVNMKEDADDSDKPAVNKAAETDKEINDKAVQAVKERLRFFLSDANLRQDYFVRKQMLATDGDYPRSITVETLLRFNTIKQHTDDPHVVVAAAQALPEILVVSDDCQAIGRVQPFSLDRMDDNIPLSLMVENLPVSSDSEEYQVTADDIRQLLEPTYGTVAVVKLRFHHAKKSSQDADNKKKNKTAAGSCLVEFERQEDMEKAAADLCAGSGAGQEAKQMLQLQDSVLSVVKLQDYIDAAKKKRKHDEDEEKDEDSKGNDDKSTPSKKFKPFELEWKPGCVIRLQGLPLESCDREAILDGVAAGLGISVDDVVEQRIYVDYSRGQEDGAIRFSEPSDSVQKLADKLVAGDLEIKGSKVKTVKILQGEEESKYWNDFIAFKNKQRQQRAEERSPRKKHRKSRH